jgi:hypothetical protein
MTRKTATALIAGTAAVLVAGYAAAGPTGLIDAASVAATGVLIAARGLVRGGEPPYVRAKKILRLRRPAASTAEFPAYGRIFSDLSWAQVSWRHYEHPLRPTLARLAEALDRQGAVELPEGRDPDGPGPDLAALDRIITSLEG